MSIITADEGFLGKIDIHDRLRFETKFDYPFVEGEKKSRYSIEAYFFIPASLQLNANSYPIDNFYADIKGYVRFKTPQMTLEQLYAENNRLSPLKRIRDYVEELLVTGKDRRQDIIYESKMLVAILRVALRDVTLLISKLGSAEYKSGQRDAQVVLHRSLKNAKLVMNAFRKQLQRALSPLSSDEFRQSLNFIDEYLSLTVESFAVLAYDELERIPNCESSCEELLALLVQERKYRKNRGYPSLPEPQTDNEQFIYRLSMLKKYVSNILFLEIARTSARKKYETTFFAIGAGLAMLFSTLVVFFAQSHLVHFSWALVVVFVCSYMVKDRLKEYLRYTFDRFISNHFCDFETNIYDPNRNSHKLGNSRQKALYLPSDKVPRDVLELRNRGRTELLVEREFEEQVIRYQKQIALLPQELEEIHVRVRAVTDIIRFNVRNFLGNMDEPVKKVRILDPRTHRPQVMPASKVYHLNVIFRFKKEQSSSYVLKKLRVILDRNGIKRVERFDGSKEQ
jgi:hypothetical protein